VLLAVAAHGFEKFGNNFYDTVLWNNIVVWIVNKECLAFIQKNPEFTVYRIVNLGIAENGTENIEMFVDYTVNQWELLIKYKDFRGYLGII